MKIWKVFILITLGVLILVNGAFIFVEKIYIKSNDEIIVEEIKDEDPVDTEDVDITLQDGAKGVQATEDGQYIAYSNNGQIKIIDSKDDSIFDYENITGGEIAYFKWVSGGKNLFIIEKVQEDGEYYLKPITFNAKTKEASQLIDFDKNESKLLISNEEIVENVIFAPECNYIYIKIKNKSGKNDLYTINVMNQVKKIRENINIDNMVVPREKPKLIMESDSKISLIDSKENIEIPGVDRYRIIGADGKNKIYIGNERDGKITDIYFSEIGDNNSFSWDKIVMDEPLSMDDIKVEYSGKLYLVYKDKGLIKEAGTGVSVEYNGNILQAYSNGVISVKDNKITKVLVK